MRHPAIVAALALASLLASCTLSHDFSAQTMTEDDVYFFQRTFMSSYWAERGGSPSIGRGLTPFLPVGTGGSRATVAVERLSSTSFATLAGAAAGDRTLRDYPEPGQTTVFTVSPLASGVDSDLRVYDITATTSFPAGDLRKTYVEEYYVQDIGLDTGLGWNTGTAFDGAWKVDDPIVTKDANGTWVRGANGLLTQDQKARIRQVLTFQDGSTRTETIVAASNAGGALLDPAPFAVDGSLDFSAGFVPAPTTDTDVLYSSIVVYHVSPAKNPNFWFWQGSDSQTILGIRYYTEERDSAARSYTASTLSFEKTLSTLTTSGGSMTSTVAGVFAGSQWDTLAESVLRQRVVYDLAAGDSLPSGAGRVSSNMRTRVVNITGKKDFYLEQLDSDAARLTSLDTSIALPAAEAEELVAGDPGLFTFMRTQQVTPATGTLPFAIATADLPGQAGALSTVYTAITEQTFTDSDPSAPSVSAPAESLLPAAGAVASFNGQQTMGTLIPASAATASNTMGSKGTVEAWIYIDAYTNTAGIVHKGVAKDFSDECFSLQGWGSNGQVGIILDKPTGTNSFDSVLSKVQLKTKTWYYLVATWDTSLGTSSYIRLYVNADRSKLGNAGKPTVAAYRENGSGLLVGSQLPTIYSGSYGYFGFNGKITGAALSPLPMSDAEVLSRYNLYKGQTGNW